MQIENVSLKTAHLPALTHFYGELLGLPVTLSPPALSIEIGTSTLTYEQDETFTGFYHLAFEVPRNLTPDAQAWLSERVPLLTDAAGQSRFGPSERWNTTNFYFSDPAGNILELIARHDRKTDQPGPFSPARMLNISELGMVVGSVPEALEQLHRRYDLRPFNGQSDTFTAVGGHDGMLIVVPVGRGWFPVEKPATHAPFRATFDAGRVIEMGQFHAQG